MASNLVWSDEFNGPDGSQPDPAKWTMQNWYENTRNQELETFTDRPKNVDIWQGNLRIRAYRETYTGPDGITKNYTSGKIFSLGKFSAMHGTWEARIKMPYSQGMHCAFWMVGDNVKQVGWPQAGEIDVMENIGRQPSTNHGTLHGPPANTNYADAGIGAAFTLPNGQKFASSYHLFAIDWQPNIVKFYVDGKPYETRTPKDFLPGNWVFEHPFYIIISFAVGGVWPGSPDGTTVLPQTMLVDYVRVYQ